MAHAVGFTVALMPQAVPTTWSNSEEAIGTSRQFIAARQFGRYRT